MDNQIDLLLSIQQIQGYDDPQAVLECWNHFCYYKMLGYQPQETDPELLLHYLLYYYWNDEETVLQACVNSQDILDLRDYGFFGSIESKQMAWEYYCELFNDPSGLIPNDAVEFFGLDTQDWIEVPMQEDSDECHVVDEGNDLGMDSDVSMDSDDVLYEGLQHDIDSDVAMESDEDNISAKQWMEDHDVVMMYGEGREQQFEIVSERPKSYPNFPLTGREITIRSLATSISDPEEYVNNLFDFAMEHLLRDIDLDSKVGFRLESSNCKLEKPIYIPFLLRLSIFTPH